MGFFAVKDNDPNGVLSPFVMVTFSMPKNMLSRHRAFKASIPELGVDLMKLAF